MLHQAVEWPYIEDYRFTVGKKKVYRFNISNKLYAYTRVCMISTRSKDEEDEIPWCLSIKGIQSKQKKSGCF